MPTAVEVLAKAAALVSGDRAASHGDMLQNHECIASLWNGYLNARAASGLSGTLDAHDVANMMECMKVARRLTGAFNADDFTDACGYSAIACEVRERTEQKTITSVEGPRPTEDQATYLQDIRRAEASYEPCALAGDSIKN